MRGPCQQPFFSHTRLAAWLCALSCLPPRGGSWAPAVEHLLIAWRICLCPAAQLQVPAASMWVGSMGSVGLGFVPWPGTCGRAMDWCSARICHDLCIARTPGA